MNCDAPFTSFKLKRLTLTMFGDSSLVSPDSPLPSSQTDINHDRIIPHLGHLAERSRNVHAVLYDPSWPTREY